jgi:hypothetical protein
VIGGDGEQVGVLAHEDRATLHRPIWWCTQQAAQRQVGGFAKRCDARQVEHERRSRQFIHQHACIGPEIAGAQAFYLGILRVE